MKSLFKNLFKRIQKLFPFLKSFYPKQGDNTTNTQEDTGRESEWENFRRTNRKPNSKPETIDKPLLLIKWSLIRAIGEPIYTY